MNTMILSAQPQQSSGYPVLIMMAAIFAIMWFFMIRPQQKKQKEIRKFQNSLDQGMKVVTGGGIYGTVKRVNLTDNTLDLEIAHGVVITVDKSCVYADMSSQAPKA